MADEWFDLPDGTQVNIPADYTRAQLSTLFDQLSEEFPDSIGRAWSVYGQDGEEEEDEGNIFGKLYQAVENIPRGAASVPLMGAQGIAALISPHKDTAIEKKLRGAKDWLFSGVDPRYRDSKIANIGLGVGQMAPLMLGGAGLASLGVGAAVPGMLTRNLGVNMGSKAVQLLGGAKGVQGIAAGSLMSVPMHYGQWASGISDYEQRTGQDVSALKELAGFAPATLLGIGEMLPLSMMPGIGAVAKQSAGLIGAGLAKKGLVSNATAFLTGAATEAVQESASELGQMAMARALYDDEALEEMGSRIWDAGIIGGGAGGIVSVLTNLAIRGAAGGRGPLGQAAAAEDALLRAQKLKDPDPNLAVARAREEGMPVAPDQETLDANRRKRLSDELLKEEAKRAEQRRYPLAPVAARQQRPDGGLMVTMTPDKFLAANKPLELDEESLETIAKFRSHIEGGGELDPVMLYDEALPNGQLGDGRHRAYAARELGIEEIPVQDFRPQEVTGVLPAYEEFVALTPEEFDAKVERKFVEDKAKEAAQDQAAQEARTRAREDSGATFLELDELSDLSAEEILDLFNNEQVTAETYIELLIADRLGNVGRESREELKEFAKVNAEVNNTYTPALVAAAALAGHPRLSIEAETISESVRTMTSYWPSDPDQLGLGLPEGVDPAPGRALEGPTIEPEETGVKLVGVERASGDIPSLIQRIQDQDGLFQREDFEDLLRTDGDAPARIADNLDGDVSQADFDEAREWLVRENEAVRERLPETITVYRSNDLINQDFVEVTTRRDVAERFANRRGVDVVSFDIPRSAVLIDVEGLSKGFSAYDEAGLLIRGSDVPNAPPERIPGLGERGKRAVEILAEYLTPESQALLAQESLSPAEVNTIIDEASSTEGFDKAETDDLIYGFTGNVGLYDRVNQNSQEQAVVWRYDETGQLELVLPNPREEEASVFIREVVAKASGPEGAKGTVDIWKNHSRFESPLLKLLDIKNIELHKDRNTGETGLNSDGFKTLLYRVAGTTDLTGLTPGQRRALFGRIANLPTFSNPTPLPDLSRPLYSAAQVQAVLGELRFARDKATRQGEPWVEVRDLVGSREGDAPAAPKLPTELKNSRAGYGQTVLEFDSDVDRAAYIVRDRTNLSKRDSDFVAWLASQGIDIDAAVAHGNRVKEFIKTSISGQDTFTVPAQADVTPVTADATSGTRLTNLLEAKQLVRHLVEAGYVTTQKRKGSKGAMGLQVYLNEVTRPSTVEATDAATDPERAAREAKAVKKSETEKRLASRFQEVRTALIRRLKRYNLPGLEEVLSADLNSIWGAIEGVIESPGEMANSVAMLDGPNAKLWVSLSQIDPDGTRPIKDIIQDVTEEVVHAYDRQGYWFDDELSTMDSRAFDTVVPASVSEQAHKDGLNFVQFAEKLYPNLNQQDLMSEARAKYMTALAKGQLPRGRTAGKVGNLKDKIISFFTAGIESGRDAEMQRMLQIFADFESGEVGRRGTPIPGSPRSLRLSRYADPRHLRELKKAIEAGDKDAEQRIAQDILDEKKFDMAQSAPPELTWRDKLFNQFMMDEELANTKPGEIPPIGLNASERAINEYFRQKRGEQPYTMPEAIKHKFRNQEQWAPSEELESHIGDRVSRTKAEPKLGGEVLLDSMSEMTDALSALHNDEAFDKLTEVQQVNETRRVINGYAKAWSKPWTGLSFKARKDSFWSMLRYNIADGAYPIEKLGQLTDRVRDGIRSLADTSAVSAIRWRNSSGFIMESVLHKGAISWVGTPEDGVHQFIEYTPEQETLIQMMAHLESATDRKYAAVYSGALRFLDMTRKRLNGEAQAGLDLAEAEGNQANIRYFKKQLEVRPWDVNLSIDEQIASAEKTVALIEAESANVVQFSKSYQAHNKDNLNYLLAKEQITQEMYDYLQDMTYVPLHKDIGMMEAWPLGSSGRGEGSGKSVVVGTMGTADNHVFEHALEDFDGLEDMDLIKNIMSSEMAMIRDTFTNTAARRVVRDTQELTEKGFGAQSRQVDEAGPNVIRIMVKGQEEYHELADPLLANAVMTLGFASTNNFLKVARAGAQVTRWGVVNFPAFIYRNFLKDARSVNSINAAAEGSFFPALNSIRRVVGGNVLQRSRMAGLVSGGGAYVTQQELMSGKGQLQEVLEGDSMIAKGLKAAGFGSTGKRLARQAKMQAQYEKVSADLAEGGMPLKSLSDYYAYIAVSYNNIQQIGESAARLGAYDSVLAATGNRAEAMLAGLETMNYGRRGASPLLNAITSMIPFMAGGITGTDSFIRSWTGSPDTIGKSAVDSRMNDEAAKTIRNRLFIRAMHAVGALFIYYMMVRDEDWYKNAGEVEKMNNFIIPIGNKYIKVPVSFASGSLFKAMPESILRMIDEADYTPADVSEEAVDQVKRNLGFHIAPQIMRPMWYAMQNKNDFTREPIVNQYMEGLPEEHQRNDYTSDSAAVLARIFGVLPGVKTLSSPMKMEYLIRSYFGQAGTYAMLAADRVTREVTGKNIVGTRYDWSPLSLLTGEGIENFPIVGDVVGDLRKGRGEVDEFYELKNEVDIYVSILNKLMREGSPEEVQDWIAKNIDTHNYQGRVRAFGRYNTKWNQRRDRLLESDWMSDDRKRELLFEMIEERDEVLDGLTSVKAGMRGLLPQQEFVR